MLENFMLAAAAAIAAGAAAPVETVDYSMSVGDLLAASQSIDGSTPQPWLFANEWEPLGLRRILPVLAAVRVEQGEGIVVADESPDAQMNGAAVQWNVVVRVPAGVRPSGELWLPVEGERYERPRLARIPFQFPLDAPRANPGAFALARAARAARLARMNVPGRPYFDAVARRDGAKETSPARGGVPSIDGVDAGVRRDGFDESFELFTGGRALQENLQVDRMRGATAPGEATIPVETIQGITIEPIDFKKLAAGLEPTIEPLAAWVPSDQIYVAFPSFTAMVRLLDEMGRRGDSLIQSLEPRSEDARTRARLERQLCLSTSLVARLLGPKIVKSVAFTASDPYLREGTDVAVLFECVATMPIEQRLALGHAEARQLVPGCVESSGEHQGSRWTALVSPDRRVSSYSATVDDVVIVTNSRVQLERLLDAKAGTLPVLATADEFRFFRGRYPPAPERDAALIVLSDPFLRRFCGPAWRIAESRRLRCAAVQARLEGLRASGATEDANALAASEQLGCPVSADATYAFVAGGARCSLHGGAGFLTPVAETPATRASEAEKGAYDRFRNNYQSYFREYFDPIAIEIAPGDPLELDVTVLPLITETEYTRFRDLAYGGGELDARHGDPHPDALLHFIAHVNPESQLVKELSSFTSSLPGVKGVPWLGDSVEFYVDSSPVLDTFTGETDPEPWLREHFGRLPIAARVAIRDPLSFALFLAAARTMIETSAPQMLLWENRTHDEQPYVVVRAKPGAEQELGEMKTLQICYGTVAGGWCVTLDEEVMKRALARGRARAAAPAPAASPWPGKHVALTFDVQRALPFCRPLMEEPAGREAALCFANLPALDAWRARDAERDPIEQHADLFGVTLVCPTGGAYGFDDALAAFVCSKHGHPTAPHIAVETPKAISDLARISAGLTFEEQGLRVRVQAERAK